MARHMEQLYVQELYVERKFELLKPQWNDQLHEMGGMSRAGNNDPAWTQIDSTGVLVPGFAATGTDELFFGIQVKHDVATGSLYTDTYDEKDQVTQTGRIHIHWMPNSTNTGNVVWKLTVVRCDRAGTYDATDYEVTVAANGTAWREQITDLQHIDISNDVESQVYACRIARENPAEDTFTGIALGLYVDTHFPIFRLGSENEYGDQ